MSTVFWILIAIFLVVGTLNAVATTVELWRAPDALSRSNIMGTLATITFPCFVLAYFFFDWLDNGFSLSNLILSLIAIIGILVVGSAGTFVMGRAIHHTKE
ncbi:MAG: monovalent cation/H(+) antiporter subunit G [Corynebacterium sp.]|nr:monovalent cation/H(+) antiporter subunit G [Corynebacterium sp.]